MRRYTFYISVALLTFWIGIFGCVCFVLWRVNELESAGWKKMMEENHISHSIFRKTSILKIREVQSGNNENLELFSKNEGFKCENKFLITVWNNLRQIKDFREASDDKIKKGEINNCSEIIGIDKLIDLNNDGIEEAIVGGKSMFVNGANNRTIWIVQKIGKVNKILLEDIVEDYEIKTEATNGFRNIFTKHHASCCSSYQTTYKFGSRKYRENKCQFVNFGTTGVAKVTTCDEENARIEKESHQNKSN